MLPPKSRSYFGVHLAYSFSCVLLASALFGPFQTLGQDRDSPYENYFEHRNLQENYQALLDVLENLQSKMSAAKGEKVGEQVKQKLARDLTLNGVSPSGLEAMASTGFNIFSMYNIDAGKPQDDPHDVLRAYSLTHDLVVIGTIESVEMTSEFADGYGTTLSVRIEETLRGDAPGSNITIRQRTGRTRGGGRRVVYHGGDIIDALEHPDRVEGRKYLFFLSSGEYGFRKTLYRVRKRGASWEKPTSQNEAEPTYALGFANAVEDGKMIPRKPKNKNGGSGQEIEEVSSIIKEVDRKTESEK